MNIILALSHTIQDTLISSKINSVIYEINPSYFVVIPTANKYDNIIYDSDTLPNLDRDTTRDKYYCIIINTAPSTVTLSIKKISKTFDLLDNNLCINISIWISNKITV